MNKTLSLIAASVLTLCAAGAFAQANPPAGAASMPRVDQRQANQEARIQQGVASGALTPREQHRLEREQKGIAKAEAHAEADGKVTSKERARLHHMQDGASRDIRHQKHDRQRAASVPAN
jgi:hypothetical protein